MIYLIGLLLAFAYLAGINILTYRAFATDKRYAINKEPRTPEAHLLYLARIGGWGGAKLAQQKLRHKSYKQPFGQQLNAIGMLQGAGVVTFGAIIGALALSPVADPLTAPAAVPALQAAPPDPVPPLISLRPPAGRPARS